MSAPAQRFDVGRVPRGAPTWRYSLRVPARPDPRNAKYTVERKSSASPSANFPIMFAVAGATSSRSFSCATPICSMELESVASGLAEREEAGNDLSPRQRGESERADELFGGTCEHGLHFMTVLYERAGNFRGLICRDPAAHPKNDAHLNLPSREREGAVAKTARDPERLPP